MKSGNWNENIEIEIMIEIVFFRVRIAEILTRFYMNIHNRLFEGKK